MKNEMMKKVVTVFSGLVFKLKKYSPEILIVTGIAGGIAGTVMACKATTKAVPVLEKAKEELDTIHKNNLEESLEDSCSQEDTNKKLASVYTHTGIELIKLYAPSLILGGFSITSILASNNILRKRSAAIGAAYVILDKSFKEYRGRVIERFGKEVDRELKNNVKSVKFKETETDPETGKEKKVEKTAFVVNPSDISGYARFFEQYTTDESGKTILNPHWESNNEYNLMFIKAQERYANDLLHAKKRLFLNDVYEMLGLPRTKAGQVVGWVYNPENPSGDNYVDFGLYADNLSYSDFVNGHDPAILLDFNVDGNVWESM